MVKKSKGEVEEEERKMEIYIYYGLICFTNVA
jgi:hypothetical protein